MSEELKNEQIETNCKQCECCKKVISGLKEFCFKTLIVYIGVTLAIITSANILKPKHHYPYPRPYPRFERQLPPPMMHKDFNKRMHFKRGHMDFKVNKELIKNDKANFPKPQRDK